MFRKLISNYHHVLRVSVNANGHNGSNGTLKYIAQSQRYRYGSATAQPASNVLNYSLDDKEKILKTINTSALDIISSFDLSKVRAQKIQSWKKKNGQFSNIEQMLDIDGFGLKNLAKFCNSIVQDKSQLNDGTLTKRVPIFTTPAIDAVDSLNIKSCVALYVGISSISSIRLQIDAHGKGINVSDWNHYDFADTRYHLYDLIQSVSQINYLIPSADVYVLEAPPIARPTGPGSATQLNINIQRSQLVGMISLALNDRTCTKEYHRNAVQAAIDMDVSLSVKHKTLLFLKQFAASRLYSTTVGGERVSNGKIVEKLTETCGDSIEHRQNYVKSIIENKSDTQPSVDDERLRLKVGDKSRQVFASAKEYRKEYMGNALLIGLTFLRLCVFRDSDSLKAMSSAGKTVR